MDRDIRTYFLFIGIPAVFITAAGLLTLIFGVRGITAEMEFSDRENQKERYEDRIKGRMANRLKAYLKTGKAEFVWKSDSVPWGTNRQARTKYGIYVEPAGANRGRVIGWARVNTDTVIGCRMPPFREEGRATLHLFLIGAVMVTLLFFTLFAGGMLLARAAKRAREELEVKNSFLDVISHELNTPLGSIVPLSSALASGRIKDAARKSEAINAISRESARMARMISELLTVVRLRNGKLSFARERIDVRGVAEHAASLVCVRHPDREIMLEEGSPMFAFADPDKFEQVMVNLIENACRYADEDAVTVSCSQTDDGVVRVDVADRGPGLSEDERKRVFERFYQTSADAPDSGLGLGLNIVSGFVAGMGGKVDVRPREGGGSVFSVELPGCGGAQTEGF